MNIPIYRGLKIGTENEYVEGYFICKEIVGHWVNVKSEIKYLILLQNSYISNCFGQYNKEIEIYPTTLAIHFPDMLDSQGNKIFASLSEDGKGGDMVEVTIPFRKQEYKYECYVYYKNTRIKTSSFEVNSAVSKEYKVIGIQK